MKTLGRKRHLRRYRLGPRNGCRRRRISRLRRRRLGISGLRIGDRLGRSVWLRLGIMLLRGELLGISRLRRRIRLRGRIGLGRRSLRIELGRRRSSRILRMGSVRIGRRVRLGGVGIGGRGRLLLAKRVEIRHGAPRFLSGFVPKPIVCAKSSRYFFAAGQENYSAAIQIRLDPLAMYREERFSCSLSVLGLSAKQEVQGFKDFTASSGSAGASREATSLRTTKHYARAREHSHPHKQRSSVREIVKNDRKLSWHHP